MPLRPAPQKTFGPTNQQKRPGTNIQKCLALVLSCWWCRALCFVRGLSRFEPYELVRRPPTQTINHTSAHTRACARTHTHTHHHHHHHQQGDRKAKPAEKCKALKDKGQCMADEACAWDGKACELSVAAEACKTLMEMEKCVAFMACAWDMSKDTHCTPRPRPKEVGGTQGAAPAHGPIETSKQVFSKVLSLSLYVYTYVYT